jgi:DNA polymerase-3 subunit epsilon
MEIGCLEMIGGKITGLEFHAFLHPRYTINEVTKQKTNLTSNFYDEYYKDAYASDHKVLEQFKNFVNQSVIVAHNASKDMEFINNEFIFHKINIFPKKKFFCTLNIFRQMFPDISRGICSLSKCCEYLDIKLPNKNFHSAIYDSFMVAKLMSKLFDIKEQVLENKNNMNTSQNNRSNNSYNYNSFNNFNRHLSINFENRNFINHNNENYQTNTDLNFFNSYNSFNDKNNNSIKLIEEEVKNAFSFKEQNKNTYVNNKNDINFKKINSVNVISSSNNFDNIFSKKIEESKKDSNKINDIGNKDIKLLNNKRKLDFKDLIQNLKNKVNPKNNEAKSCFNKNDIDLNANDFNVINKLIKE